MTRFGLILLAFNRPKHTARVLRALRDEGLEELTVYVDGPRDEQDRVRQLALGSLFSRIDWAEVRVKRRERNLGLAKSVELAVREELQEKEFVAVLEDDCVPRSGFLKYMREASSLYKDNPGVRSVCGYQYPLIDRDGPITDVALERFNPWGWGTWRDRWAEFSDDLPSLVKKAKATGCFDRLGMDLREYCSSTQFLEGKADIWSINWILTHYLADSLAVFPSRSLIENIGFDGTGVHSIETDTFNSSKPARPGRLELRLSAEPKLDRRVSREIERFLREHSLKCMRHRVAVA